MVSKLILFLVFLWYLPLCTCHHRGKIFQFLFILTFYFYVEEYIVKEMLLFLSPWVYFQEAENKDNEVLGGS